MIKNSRGTPAVPDGHPGERSEYRGQGLSRREEENRQGS